MKESVTQEDYFKSVWNHEFVIETALQNYTVRMK